ncbi:hypothetical protein [Afipia birgiae]|uniref:hypothetical protein n=1 Tax=Afipia birgiae TaxID=151414 RepID=UPI00030DBBCE|nr:hypothetical protein [Afipia birgiae]MBX9822635.1 hypothetical protein [Afipia birgiae]
MWLDVTRPIGRSRGFPSILKSVLYKESIMQCYDEAGELVEDFRVCFFFDETDPQIVRRVALIQGRMLDLGRTPVDAYIEEIDDPFWINDSDHLYINSGFEYASNLHEWIAAQIADRGQAQLKVIEIDPRDLSASGLQIPARQMRAFQDGQPIWRRSAFSCNPGPGTDGQSSISRKLRDALYSWVVFCDLFARHAMRVEKDNKNSKFFGKKGSAITNFTRVVLGRAFECVSDIKASEIGISKLLLGSSAFQFDSARSEGRSQYFNDLFAVPPQKLLTLIGLEMSDFKKHNRLFDAQFDSDALVEWSASILVVLRIALAASSDLDGKRSTVRDKLMNEKRQDERERLARQFTLEWLKGVRGVKSDGREQRDIDLEELFDLQRAALIAFAAGVDPRVLFPYIYDGIYDGDRRLLSSPLFAGAVWLGELFRKRYLQMEYAHASHIAAFCNPHSLPRELPLDRREEWIAATRMITSFMTEKGLGQLMDGANAVLNDGKTRSVFASVPRQLRAPKKPASIVTVQTSPSIHIQIGDTPLPPPPIIVEAGWLILPGDYQEAWAGKCNPFEPDDFSERYRGH